MAGSCSRFTPASKDAHLDAAWGARLASGDTAMWATRPLTAAPRHGHLPLASVRQVLQARVEGRPATFRLLVRLAR